MTGTARELVARFFDEFVEAFATFDGEEIARRYAAPCVAMHADGTADSFETAADVAAYFQGVVDEYHAAGCRSCRYTDLEVVPVGSGAALGTVTWELLREDGSAMATWRESYNLVRSGDRMRAFATVDHEA